MGHMKGISFKRIVELDKEAYTVLQDHARDNRVGRDMVLDASEVRSMSNKLLLRTSLLSEALEHINDLSLRDQIQDTLQQDASLESRLRDLARVSNLSYNSCQTLDEAADEINKLEHEVHDLSARLRELEKGSSKDDNFIRMSEIPEEHLAVWL